MRSTASYTTEDAAAPGREAMLRTEVWPLPCDDALLVELDAAVRAVVNVVLTQHGITNGDATVLPTAVGPAH